MRTVAILIVLVIACSLVGGTVPGLCLKTAGAAALQTLDVCHSATPFVNPEIPCMTACPCAPLPLQVAGTMEPQQKILHPVVLAFQDEHPPKSL